MLHTTVILNLLMCACVASKHKDTSENELGASIITSLRNDANLDLSVDEEYEDLRAELLAYHTALASLTSDSRRSMKTTTCWTRGGICVPSRHCLGYSKTEVPGCKTNEEVCCFAWNKYQVRDMRDKGISILAMPWSHLQEYGGKGVLKKEPEPKKKSSKKKLQNKNRRTIDDKDRRALVVLLNKK